MIRWRSRRASSGSNRRSGPLADPVRFLAYLMTYGTIRDIAVVRRHLALDDFPEALERAPPGIIDERSWAYWNVMTGRYPVPPMPRRAIPGT
jgi:hypothetical protein